MDFNKAFVEKNLEAAQESVVILRNENNVLPFTDSDKVSVFGRCQIDFYKSGAGSGGLVNVPYKTNLIEGLLRQKPSGHNPLINKELLKVYRKWLKENPFDKGSGLWASEPLSQKEMPVDEQLALDSAAISDNAVFVIGRTAGEEQDLKAEKGSYYLTDTESEALKNICAAFEKVVVVLNVPGIIDLSWINSEEFAGKISSIVYACHGGMEGGNAVADVLCGVVNASGKLADTIPYSLDDIFATQHFGNTEKNFYAEDIYVGYRYFETFASDKILFPFGFGLSYTEFSVTPKKLKERKGIITAVVKVKNIGKEFSGKQVVQVYYEAPQGRLGKAARELVAFKKTKLLKPGEKEVLKFSFNVKEMASYDETGITGYKSSYVLEKGKYFFYIGTDSHSAENVVFAKKDFYELNETVLVNKLQQVLAPTEFFERIKPGEKNAKGNYTLRKERVPLNNVDLKKRIQENLPQEIPFTGDVGIKFKDVKRKPSKIDAFIGQLNENQLATLVRAEGMNSEKTVAGLASAFGGTSKELYEFGIPVAGCSDGPSGIRRDNGKTQTQVPCASALACTWNEVLVKELFEFEGKEIADNKIDLLLGPGMNIHRYPLNGRNFEYFSEDPIVTAKMVNAEIQGLWKSGTIAAVKHFATNNQETNRHFVNSIVSERALREIYLKAFQIAVEKGGVKAVMTTYNPLNGHWTGSNYDLVNTVLHKEWNYSGMVMTDWWARLNDCLKGGESSITLTASMVKAHTDIFMVVDNNGAEKNVYGDNIASEIKNGNLTLAELQQCAKSIILLLTKTTVAKRKLHPLGQAELLPCVHSSLPSDTVYCKTGEVFAPSNDGSVTKWIYIDEAGTYNAYANLRKENDIYRSLSVCNIMFDGRPGISFANQGTDNKIETLYMGHIRLEKGYYEISLNHTKKGIEVQDLNFLKADESTGK